MVLACCVIRDRPRASKKSLRVPRTIQAESAPRPLTARSTFRGRCSRATSKRKPRKYISTSRSLNVETLVRRTFVVENILLLIRSKTKAKRSFLARRNSWRKRRDESSSNSSTTTTITTSFVLFREKKKTTTTRIDKD